MNSGPSGYVETTSLSASDAAFMSTMGVYSSLVVVVLLVVVAS